LRLGSSEILFIVIFWIPTIWALFDVLRAPGEAWAVSGENQIVWTIVVILIPVAGPLAYFFIARPRLVAARASAERSDDGA